MHHLHCILLCRYIYVKGLSLDPSHLSGILRGKVIPAWRWSQSRKKVINVPAASTSGCLGLRMNREYVRSANRRIGTSHERTTISRSLAERKGLEPTGVLGACSTGVLQTPSSHEHDFSPLKGAGWEGASLTFIPGLRRHNQSSLFAILSPIHPSYIREDNICKVHTGGFMWKSCATEQNPVDWLRESEPEAICCKAGQCTAYVARAFF